MPKQEFETSDYVAPLCVAAVFAAVVFVVAVFLNFFCILKDDDETVFEKMGQRNNLRLGRPNSGFSKKEYKIVSDEKQLIN
uniref:Col_cuticle_N domain-containing protein n=1 Tax=Steinernema glaseri TaxID=37863 RepID=A0A1I7ZFW1_9BILA